MYIYHFDFDELCLDEHFPDTCCCASHPGPERGMSEAANPSVRPRAAESGPGDSVPAADQARLGPASPGVFIPRISI